MRITGSSVYLKTPSRKDISLIQNIWSDGKTMESVGGTVIYTDRQMANWYESVVLGSDTYFLILSNKNECIGEVSMHRFNADTGEGEFNIKIMHEQRNKGYGMEALKLFIDYLSRETSVEFLTDNIRKSNREAALFLEKAGFERISQNGETAMYKKNIKNQENTG